MLRIYYHNIPGISSITAKRESKRKYDESKLLRTRNTADCIYGNGAFRAYGIRLSFAIPIQTRRCKADNTLRALR